MTGYSGLVRSVYAPPAAAKPAKRIKPRPRASLARPGDWKATLPSCTIAASGQEGTMRDAFIDGVGLVALVWLMGYSAGLL